MQIDAVHRQMGRVSEAFTSTMSPGGAPCRCPSAGENPNPVKGKYEHEVWSARWSGGGDSLTPPLKDHVLVGRRFLMIEQDLSGTRSKNTFVFVFVRRSLRDRNIVRRVFGTAVRVRFSGPPPLTAPTRTSEHEEYSAGDGLRAIT